MGSKPLWWAAIAFATGCFSPDFEDGTIPCGNAGCPDGLSCAADGFCYRDPAGEGDPDDTPPSDSGSVLALAVGNRDAPSRVYAHCGGDEFVEVWTAPTARATEAIAWGDADGDDISELAIAGSGDPLELFRYSGGTLVSAWSSETALDGAEMAWGDQDGDGDDELALGRIGAPLGIYGWNGGGFLELRSSAPWSDDVSAVGWADRNGDGKLDIAQSERIDDVVVFELRGQSGEMDMVWSSEQVESTESLAWADVDGDGDADLAVGNDGQPSLVYRNQDGTLAEVAWTSGVTDPTRAVAWGDYDADGDPDLAVGNKGAASRIYRNDDGVLTEAWIAPVPDLTTSLSWAAWPGVPAACQ